MFRRAMSQKEIFFIFHPFSTIFFARTLIIYPSCNNRLQIYESLMDFLRTFNHFLIRPLRQFAGAFSFLPGKKSKGTTGSLYSCSVVPLEVIFVLVFAFTRRKLKDSVSPGVQFKAGRRTFLRHFL